MIEERIHPSKGGSMARIVSSRPPSTPGKCECIIQGRTTKKRELTQKLTSRDTTLPFHLPADIDKKSLLVPRSAKAPLFHFDE